MDDDSLLAALHLSVEVDGPPEGFWRAAIDAALTADDGAGDASTVPVMDDEPVVPTDDADPIVLDDADPHGHSPTDAADHEHGIDQHRTDHHETGHHELSVGDPSTDDHSPAYGDDIDHAGHHEPHTDYGSDHHHF